MTRNERALVASCALAAMESHKRPVAWVEWITTLSLALSTVVAVTVVSIGIARADVSGIRADADVAPMAIALLIGLLLLAMGGLIAIMANDPRGNA